MTGLLPFIDRLCSIAGHSERKIRGNSEISEISSGSNRHPTSHHKVLSVVDILLKQGNDMTRWNGVWFLGGASFFVRLTKVELDCVLL